MSKCPDCGAENVPWPEGAEAHCGRRISWAGIDASRSWQQRVSSAEACKRAKLRRDEIKKLATGPVD